MSPSDLAYDALRFLLPDRTDREGRRRSDDDDDEALLLVLAALLELDEDDDDRLR
jgi:DNA-binding transcriptional MerR regulator